MLTVGQLLKEKRLEKKLTLDQVEKTTRIRAKFLEWIENNDFSKVGSPTVLKGFIRNYASHVGVDVDQIMAFYRRQSDDSTPNPGSFRARQIFHSPLRITPTLFAFVSIGALLLIFIGFLVLQFLNFTMAPPLTIDTPKDNLVVTTEIIEVKGETDPDAVLTINAEPVQTTAGKFDVKIPLSPGLNVVTLKSVNRFQKETIVTRHLRLEKSPD